MSTRHRSRQKQVSYRGRSSIIPVSLLIVALAIVVFIAYCVSGGNTAEGPTQPEVSKPPVVSESLAPVESPVPSEAPTPDESPAPSESASPVPSETLPPASQELPSITEAPWYLTLTNASHALPDDWTVETKKLPNGKLVDARIYDALMAMINACKAEGLSPVVCSGYRTYAKQTELFERKINKYMGDGLSYDEAYAAASTIVAIPGTSEHNLGLAVDICAASYQVLDDAQANTKEQQWLMEHCAEYGFILRYTKDKQNITGIIWEPWHYRYVGVELAKEITESGLCLEEYLALYYSGV